MIEQWQNKKETFKVTDVRKLTRNFLPLNKKIFTGILAFIIVFFTMPLGHALMILIQVLLGEAYQYVGALFVGLLGIAALLLSLKKESETTRTFLGLFAGIFLWTACHRECMPAASEQLPL